MKDGLFGHVRPVLKSSFQGLSDARKIWGGFHEENPRKTALKRVHFYTSFISNFDVFFMLLKIAQYFFFN